MLWTLIVSGRVDMTPDPSDEALRQYALRLKHGAMLAESFLEAGSTAVHCDIVVGADLERYVEGVRGRPLYVVMLQPSTRAVAARERGRGTTAYRDWEARGQTLEQAVEEFQSWLADTPRLGLWIDSGDQTPQQTVDEIMQRVWDEAASVEAVRRGVAPLHPD